MFVFHTRRVIIMIVMNAKLINPLQLTEYIAKPARVASYLVVKSHGVDEFDLMQARAMLNITLGDIEAYETMREEEALAAKYPEACGNTGDHNEEN